MTRSHSFARPSQDLLSGSGLVVKEAPTGVSIAPQLIGRYALFAEIASGGMGVVHLGRKLGPTPFEPVVAIKRMHPSLAADPEFVAMFREEIRLLVSVRHPNVAPALDFVEEDGELLLVMEYVHGQSLSALARQARDFNQPIPTDICLAIACAMLEGLHAAHRSGGIVHRDVSPQNVLVGCDGAVRVVDFGVAKAQDSNSLTRAGQVKGKLGYIAPENIRGQKLDGRADMYAVAVVLWELLASARLFGAKRDSETVQDILAGDIPRPSVVSSRRLPAQVEDALLRGLASDPRQRFASAEEMAQALRAAAPIASATEVGAWVTRAAHGPLVERSRHLAWAENCALPVHPSLRPALDSELEPDDFADLTIADPRFANQILAEPDASPEPPRAVTEATEPGRQRKPRRIERVRRYALYFAAFVAVLSTINSLSKGALSAKLQRALHPVAAEPAR